MSRFILVLASVYWVWGVTGTASGSSGQEEKRGAAVAAQGDLVWRAEYPAAMSAAERERKTLLLVFDDPATAGLPEAIGAAAKNDAWLRAHLQQLVTTRLPLDACIRIQGKPVELLAHPAFAGLGGKPGIILVDFTQPNSPQYGRVTVARAVDKQQQYSPDDWTVLFGEKPAPLRQELPNLVWHTSYAKATEAAKAEGKMLLIFFCDPARQELCRSFEVLTLGDPEIASRLDKVVTARLPVDATISSGGKRIELLGHAAFSEMQSQAGIAIVDYANRGSEQYGYVVSTFPFLGDRPYSPREMAVILDLPAGTLTQRTLIYAVRTHPDRPASTNGRFDPKLAAEARSHSQHQARILLQGHHNWETRFHLINRLLPRGLMASEVCAESWPGEGLLKAAIECVRCWRFSEGHWSRVVSPQPVYAYDMRRGANGIWYATGIFGADR